MHKNKMPVLFEDEVDLENVLPTIETDPFGAYTGVPKAPDEIPVQDADDL